MTKINSSLYHVHRSSLVFQRVTEMSSISSPLISNVLISSPFRSPLVHLTWGKLPCAVFAHRRRRWLVFLGKCLLSSEKMGFQNTKASFKMVHVKQG